MALTALYQGSSVGLGGDRFARANGVRRAAQECRKAGDDAD
jgi:hypothetical protein